MLMRTSTRRTSPTAAARASVHRLWPNSKTLEELWLLGQPPLSRLLEFVESTAPDPEAVDRRALADEWRAANDLYMSLEMTEAGIANQGSHRELDPSCTAMAEEVRSHPHFRRAFDTLPTTFEMVELDSVIVYQRHVTRNFVDARRKALRQRSAKAIGTAPDAVALFRLCMPLDAPEAPVQIRKIGSHRYTFSSCSTDFRFHEAALLRPEQTAGYTSLGAVAGIVGLVVGFGSNFLNAVRVGPRVLLNNGYHRAVAMRAEGITHAPCIVQTASRVDELEISVRTRVADDPEFYFESARPPLLRDFFDPRLRKLLPIRRRMRTIEVNFEIKDNLVAE
jgi:hypothetical protein